MGLSTITQIRFPKHPCVDGRYSYQLLINRNNANPEPGAANILLLDDELSPQIVENGWSLNKAIQTQEGFKAVDNISIDMLDVFEYSGTVNGVPVTENLGLLGSTFLTTFFNDKANLYDAWIYWFDGNNPQPLGAPLDVPFFGQYRATVKPQTQGPTASTHTAFETILGIRTIQLIATATLLDSYTFGDITFSSADMVQQGQFYSGFVVNPKITFSNTVGVTLAAFGTSREDADPHLIQAAPYWTATTDLVKVDAWLDPNQDAAGVTVPFPQGLWLITIGKLIERIATVAGLTFSPTLDVHSAFDFYHQFADNANRCWPLNTTPIALSDIGICWNVFAGAHPFINGAVWDNPIAFKPTDTLSSVLSGIANVLFANLAVIWNSGTPTVNLTPYGDSQGTLPTSWVTNPDLKENEPYTGPTSVTVHNKGDSTKIVSPAYVVGSTLEKELPFRMRSYGDVNPSLALSGDYPNVIVDSSLVQFDQYKCYWMGSPATPGSNDVVLTPDCWKGLAFLFFNEGLTTTNMYPTSWKTAQKIHAATDWTNSSFALGAIYRAGATPSATPETERFSTLIYPAVAGARYFIPKGTILERTYIGVAADDGTLSGVKLGLTSTWRYDDNPNFTAAAVTVEQDPYNGTTHIVWNEDQGGPFPDIGDIPWTVVQGGNSSSQSPTSNSSSITQSSTTNGTSLHTWETRFVKFYHSGSVIEFHQMTIFKWWDPVNSKWIVQFGFCPPYGTVAGTTYGHTSFFQFDYKGTEHANAEVVGISPTGVPDYWVVANDTRKRDLLGNNQNLYYDIVHRFWSEDQGKFLDQYLLEKCNLNRRLYIHGRIKITWAGTGFGLGSWVTLADPYYPMSDRETLVDSDIDPIVALNPAIIGNASTITINFGPRIKPMSISCMAWRVNAGAAGTTGAYDLSAMPCLNQAGIGAPAINCIMIPFKILNLPGVFFTPNAGTTALNVVLTEGVSGWWTYVDVWGEVEIIGDDARVQ